jgi:hypothetical protein
MRFGSLALPALIFLLLIQFYSCSDDYLPEYNENETVVLSRDSFVISGTGAVSQVFTDTIFYNPQNDSIKINFTIVSNIDTAVTGSYGASVFVRDDSTYYLLKTFSGISDLNTSHEFYLRVGRARITSFRLSAAFISPIAAFIKFYTIRVIKYN